MSSSDLLLQISAQAASVDGRSPLNEEAILQLTRHGVVDAQVHVHQEQGFAWVHDGELDLVVSPEARGQGVGAQLLEEALVGGGVHSAWSHTDDPAAAALAASHGFTATRRLWSMRRPPGPVDPPSSTITIRAFVVDQDEADVLNINASAFAHHPEQGHLTLDGLRDRMAEPWFDPAGLLLAEVDGKVSGFHWTKVHPDGLGEVYVVGVSPTAQGLGLGRALVLAGLQHLQPREVILYVEEDNAPAVALYKSLGFEHATTDVQYTLTP